MTEKTREIKFRLGNLELQKTSGLQRVELEIVQWSADVCWMVAYWTKKEDHYDLVLFSDRVFDAGVNWTDFGRLARQGQNFLKTFND